ncbi:hypothetical protein EDD85DRAFT_997279 [Armillaria nabsnona]|nr:hypothetical protein EDD85DRAFT_997279 [Armillaria nabsnona]
MAVTCCTELSMKTPRRTIIEETCSVTMYLSQSLSNKICVVFSFSCEDDTEDKFGGKKGGSELFDVVVARPFAGGKLRDVDRVPGSSRMWFTHTGRKGKIFFVREVCITNDVAELIIPSDLDLRYTTGYDVVLRVVNGGELCVWYGMTFSSDSSCADVQVPRDRAIYLCEHLEACQTRNGKLQFLIEDNLNRDYEMGMQRDIDGRELLGRSDAEGDVTRQPFSRREDGFGFRTLDSFRTSTQISDADTDVDCEGSVIVDLATSLSFPCAPLTTAIHNERLLPRRQRATTNSVSRRRRAVFAAFHGDWRRDKWSLEKISKTALTMNATMRRHRKTFFQREDHDSHKVIIMRPVGPRSMVEALNDATLVQDDALLVSGHRD